LLHFYHPLVRWLANRLRLKQELAAAADEFAGEELAQADKPKRKARKEKKKLQEAAAALRKGREAKFDLPYVPATTRMLVGVRPASLAAVKGFQPLLAMVEENINPAATGIQLK
jgi:hypothetical protein